MSNVAAEKVFLSGIVKFPDKIFEYAEYLDETDFQHSVTRMTYEAIRSLVIDKEAQTLSKAKIVAEAKALGHQNYLSATKDGEWIDELFAETITKDEIDSHFMEVKRQSLKEKYTETFVQLRDYLSSTEDNLSTIISKVENDITSKVNMIDKGEHAIIDMRDGFEEFITELADDPGHIGLDLGYPIWQQRIGHVRNGGITFVVGTTGSGKSQFGLKAGVIAARKGLPVLILDSELNRNDQWIRVAAMLSKVPSDLIETGFWRMNESQLRDNGVNDQKRIDEIIAYGRRLRDPRLWEAVKQMPLFYQSISGLSVPDVLPHIRRWLLTHVKPNRETRVPQCLIVYDYIKLSMTNEISSGRLQEWQQNGLHVSMLHDFMKKYNVPAIAFGQTNNEPDDKGIKCVAGGKRISENVNSVTYMKRKTDADRAADGVGTHAMMLWKARYGKGLWGGYINYNADLAFGDFQEIDVGSVAPPAPPPAPAPAKKATDDDDDD